MAMTSNRTPSDAAAYRYVSTLAEMTHKRIRYGSEHTGTISVRCPGCGVVIGELHARNCEREVCPCCGGQVAECQCPLADW
jgi:hypothetical protein